ncbi:YIP1 family protein [Bacillus sp. WMMC1349]|uniref:Yip1 family protein n=1 Tax=Bacillus sp. WMMC1349 TaxID=2736254 RepID=UPI001557EC7E|nr:Yip1 family protein [Bacillus sp. WMMC1349]NPC92394.1 YIP1 family protein [Bacillus sp. WMMC1349]
MNEEIVKLKKPSLFGIITNPVKQFNRIRERPTVWLPLVIVAILCSAADFFLDLKFPDDHSVFVNINLEGAGKYFLYGILIVIGSFRYAFSYVISALVLWLIAKIGGGKTNFVTMFSLSIYISIVTAISSLMISIACYFKGSLDPLMLTNLSGYIEVDLPFVMVLLMIDIFTIWNLVLTAIGLQKTAGASKVASWIGVAILFALSLLLGYLYGLLLMIN